MAVSVGTADCHSDCSDSKESRNPLPNPARILQINRKPPLRRFSVYGGIGGNRRLLAQAPPKSRQNPPNKQKTPITEVFCLWRYRWDLNPRCACTHTTFRELHLRPLGHDTEIKITSYSITTEITDLPLCFKKLSQNCATLIG